MYTSPEVAKMFRLTNRTIINYINDGKCNPQRVGNIYIFSDENVEEVKYAILSRYNLQYLLDDNNDNDNGLDNDADNDADEV